MVLPFQQSLFELPRVEVGKQPEKGGLTGRPVASLPAGPVTREMQGFHLVDGQVGGKRRQIPLSQTDLAQQGAEAHGDQAAQSKVRLALAPVRGSQMLLWVDKTLRH